MRAIGLALVGLLALLPALEAPAADGAAVAMSDAATAWLASLSDEQRARARFALDDEERVNWHFIPRTRRGLPLEAMSPAQRTLARALLQTGLSADGLATAETVMSLEQVLHDMGSNPATRNPQWYYFSVFGDPGGETPWGWRLEGHHLSLNFTLVEGSPVAWAPAFFGANPAEVRSGSRTGLRALPREEDLARAFARSLSAEQRAAAVLPGDAPPEVLTEAHPESAPLAPAGIAAARLEPSQREALQALLEVYLGRMEAELAQQRRAAIDAAGLETVSFAWIGSLEPGAPHYYRIQGPSFLVEYDDTQDHANHVHTVWRDFHGDFGRDLLREHYETHHAGALHRHQHAEDHGTP